MTLTVPQFLQIVPIDYAQATGLVAAINIAGAKYNLDNPKRLAAFIAQCAHESQEFTRKNENLNYRPQRLVDLWKARFPDLAFAQQYAGNPEKLANYLYANRMGNGNPESGDGYKYRGGGFLQLTGKDMYAKYAKHIGKGIELAATLVRTTDAGAMDSAAWVFAIEKKLLDEADKGDFITITKRINGGLIGQKEREAIYNKALKVLSA